MKVLGHVSSRRKFLEAIGIVAGVLVVKPTTWAQGRKEVWIAGKRIKTVDIHAHASIKDVETVISGTSLDRQIGGPRLLEPSRLAMMDEWGIDVAVGGSQKGLMQPPGLAFNAVSAKALAACKTAKLPRLYWDWERRMEEAYYRWFCGTPPEHLLFALREGLDMVLEEGLDNAFERHRRLAEAVRSAVAVWSRANALNLNALVPEERSNSVTTILVAEGYDADKLRMISREKFDVSLGSGLGNTRGKAFRIGHMGYLNEPMILGALAGVEASLEATGIPYEKGGINAAVEFLATG